MIQNGSYKYLQDFVNDLEVVNDAAERSVKDVSDYAKMTCNPNDRDVINLVTNDHLGQT